MAIAELKYLSAYSPELQGQVRSLLAQDKLGAYVQQRYPEGHNVQSDKALYQFTNAIKQQYLRNAPILDKVLYDSKLDVLRHALGLHTAISRVQGSKLTAKKEIRIAALFRDTPLEFLQMIVVHELAHLREKDHNKAFYQLCQHMLPEYHQYELDLRIYLTWRDTQPKNNLV